MLWLSAVVVRGRSSNLIAPSPCAVGGPRRVLARRHGESRARAVSEASEGASEERCRGGETKGKRLGSLDPNLPKRRVCWIEQIVSLRWNDARRHAEHGRGHVRHPACSDVT